MTELITIKDLKVHYPIRSGFFNRVTDHVYAVDGVDFIIEKGKSRCGIRKGNSRTNHV